jgi:hypothetical protein
MWLNHIRYFAGFEKKKCVTSWALRFIGAETDESKTHARCIENVSVEQVITAMNKILSDHQGAV